MTYNVHWGYFLQKPSLVLADIHKCHSSLRVSCLFSSLKKALISTYPISILLSCHMKNSCAIVRGSQKKRTLRFKYSQACLWNSFNFLGFKDSNPKNLRILMVNHVWSLHCRGFCEPPNKFKVQLHIREGIHKRKDGIQKWLSLQHMNKNKIMTSKEVTWKLEFFFLLYHFLTTHTGQVGEWNVNGRTNWS